MKHHVLVGLTALSLLLCLATGLVWLGDPGATGLTCGSDHTEYSVFVDHESGLCFRVASYTSPLSDIYQGYDFSPIRTTFMIVEFFPADRHSWYEIFGFAFGKYEALGIDGSVVMLEHQVYVPYWFVMILFAIGPVLYLRAARRHSIHMRRIRDGLCTLCGYDLRASKDRCPECGTPFPLKTNPANSKMPPSL
jgi:hypothetical protein